MKRISIKYQILIIALIPVILIDAFLTLLHIESSISQAEQLLRSKGEIIAEQIAGASEFNLFSGDFEKIQHLLNQSINTNDIIYAAVFDLQGLPVAKSEGLDYSDQLTTQYYYYRQSIQSQALGDSDVFEPDAEIDSADSRTIGSVHLYVSRQQLEENKKQIFTEGLIFFCTMLLLATLLTIAISRRITRPVFTLLEHLKKVEKGKLGEVIKHIENNEIGDVQNGFNSMSQSLLANRMQLDQKIKTATVELMNAISDLEYKNRELGIARDHAQNADRVKSQFLANISHEIRTPINGIKGFINLLSRTGLNLDQKRYADIISQSTNDLASIVNEVLDLSKIESGKVEIIESEFDLFELVETARDSLYTGAMENDIDLHLIVYSDTPSRLIGDQLRLKQILINLVSNAIKFTDQGYVKLTVYMEDENETECLIKFNVEDSGIGISEQDQSILFQAFNQIESDSNRRFSGTGLGLVISKNLARLMGGDISLNSEPDSGSLFSLTLPFKQSLSDDITDNPFANKTAMLFSFNQNCLNEIQSLFNRIGFDTQTQLIKQDSNLQEIKNQLKQNLNYFKLIIVDLRHSFINPDNFIDSDIKEKVHVMIMHYDQTLIDSSILFDYPYLSVINTCNNLRQILSGRQKSIEKLKTNQIDNVAANPKKVLLVDDNPINLTLASELTQLWGHSAYEASNATEAMELFRHEKFDLILLDIQMPEIDGVTLMKMMREEKPQLDTPIAAITANLMEIEKERLLNEGFDAFISKPIEEEKLRQLLDQQSVTLKPDDKTNRPVKNVSIDYDLTVNLAAKNKKLANNIFTLLSREIPEYQDTLNKAVESNSGDDIAAIIHKLQGVTCYAGLPYLKELLTAFKFTKPSDLQKREQLCIEIINELDTIAAQLEQHFSSQHSA